MSLCFYVPGSVQIIDAIDPDTSLSFYAGETHEQITARYPGAEIWEFEEAVKASREACLKVFIKAPKEISVDRYFDMLGTLPPVNWRSGSNSESFMFMEAIRDDIHMIFCRIGEKYFELNNLKSLTHQEILDICLKTIE